MSWIELLIIRVVIRTADDLMAKNIFAESVLETESTWYWQLCSSMQLYQVSEC